MLEFVTLLLGLVTGLQPVELVTQGAVDAIELRLGDRLVYRLEDAPWVVEVDFGPHLVPHRLTATAFDATGREIDSTYQIVNYSRSSFEAAIVLEGAGMGPARSGQVLWEGALDIPPRNVELRFDNQMLPVDQAGRFELPEYDAQSLHTLEAAVTFVDHSTDLASLTLGGEYADQTSTTLTAVPVRSAVGSPWPRTEVDGWLEKDRQPLEVFTTSSPSGLLVVLRDSRLEGPTRSILPPRSGLHLSAGEDLDLLTYQVMAIGAPPLRDHPGTFRLTHPLPVDTRYGLRPVLLHEGRLVPRRGIGSQKLAKKEQKLWDSLAVAGLNATRRNTPRLVVLMISDRLVNDTSQLSVHQALEYLATIHVPILIWAPDAKALRTFGIPEANHSFLGIPGMDDLVGEVCRRLNSQTIVWVQGEFLPTEVSLSSEAPPGVSLVQ